MFDEFGKLFLQHRSLSKDIQPGKWDTSVGGHIDFGETVEEALAREAREELGLSLTTTVPLYTYIHRSDKEAEYVNTFATVCNPTEITIDYNEISEGLFFEMQTIFYVFFEKRINFTFSVPARPPARGGGPMRRSPAGRSVAAP